jgi:putative hemolysin
MPTIDIRRVIGGKNPALLKIIRRPVIRYLERVVHMAELNEALELLDGRSGLSFVEGTLEYLGVSVAAVGEEHLTAATRPMIVANHPLGGLDGVALMHVVGNVLGSVKLPANDLLLHLQGLKELFVPVNKHGSNLENARLLEEAFANDLALAHFPAGLCSRKKGRRVRDLEWQKSFIVRSRRYDRDVVPVYVDGRNSPFFYNLARLRRWFGLRFNVEMLYLADEMFKQRGKTIHLTFGRPIPSSLFHSGHSSWEWARRVRTHVYRLAVDRNAEFSP